MIYSFYGKQIYHHTFHNNSLLHRNIILCNILQGSKEDMLKCDKKKRTTQISEKSLFFMKQITFLCHIQPHNFHLERYINIPLTNRINFFITFTWLVVYGWLDTFLFPGNMQRGKSLRHCKNEKLPRCLSLSLFFLFLSVLSQNCLPPSGNGFISLY